VQQCYRGSDVDRWDALADPGLRAALTFVRSRPTAPSARELATALDVPASVARWRLERLVAAGLLQAEFVRPARVGPGAGRPTKTYAVVPETAAIEFPTRRYAELLRLLISSLPTRGRNRRLAEVGEAFGRELGRAAALRPAVRPATAFDRICQALGRLGFQARVESVSDERAVVVTPTCPLRPLVVADGAARTIDAAMWRGLVKVALRGAEDADVRCAAHGCVTAGSPCRVVVGFAREQG
jgi:predicted ArsR family transcriptional regulator